MAKTKDCRAIVAKFVNAIRDGRLDDAGSLLHDEFVIHATGGVPYSGDYHGRAEFFELLMKIYEVLELTPSPEMQYLVDDEQGKVVLYYHLTFTARASGESVEMSVAEVLSVRDGLIVELDVFYKNPSVVSALLAV
jgi:uncharacterized protein